ncbi:MAG: hydantoinase B/oxoprolinase family protein [Verrucomicrobiae bacterium]|nr:hydantoinase B/oxoprolinase family protein [Verrucomicrobiae bacterium]
MFKLRVDTGGTFTDCWALAEGESHPRLAKVLSSGRLRVPVREWTGETELTITVPSGWRTGDTFFTGYKLESGGESALVLSYSAREARLVLSRPVPKRDSIDLFTREEAPVLGARLLTGTPLDRPFPEIEFRLATTRGTNALLERKGAKVALFVTSGFADLPIIRDQRRADLFALRHERPAPLFSSVMEVDERIAADGRVLKGLSPDANLNDRALELLEAGIDVAAVALLHSHRNPVHEIALRDHLLALGFAHVSTSAELAPLVKILPRLETALANATLQPVMQAFVDHHRERFSGESRLLMMTSAGGLEPMEQFRPKDSLLSGPAGGVSGAAAIAEELGFERVLTFDMGGTSTDVARYDSGFQYDFEQRVGNARVLAPALRIETVAAGGGSICRWVEGGLRVGPESAGAQPGPACYGLGGPLTITDVNLLLGRIDPANFGIPLTSSNLEDARRAALDLQRLAGIGGEEPDSGFLSGLLDLAVEQMADAVRTISVREGADPSEYALLAFGGAGPLHACAIAERLGISTILVPGEAGLLSAYGLECAGIERFAERQIDRVVDDPGIGEIFSTVENEALESLAAAGERGTITRRIAELRLTGQDATLTIEVIPSESLSDAFLNRYAAIFGYTPPAGRAIEVVSYRAIAGTGRKTGREAYAVDSARKPESTEGFFLNRNLLRTGDEVSGPRVIQDPFSTLYLAPKWTATLANNGSLVLTCQGYRGDRARSRPEAVERELFRHRFDHIVREMGTMLQRSAISTNVKERADFSCALLDGDGELITSAPHIPVHLGAMGLCVRKVRERVPMAPGDTLITNHPAAGGSHLPDVTLITPIFDRVGSPPVAYIANRAHHAEIGGITPGSMPPSATCLAEEGVVIAPRHLIREGESCFDEIAAILTNAPYPTRRLSDNLADLNAQLAANRRGAEMLESLLSEHGEEVVAEQFKHLKDRSLEALSHHLERFGDREVAAEETLDDGTPIRVSIQCRKGSLAISFAGSGAVHPGNLNATPAILQSAVLYVLRLWTQSPVPLNEGLMRAVSIDLPDGFLNPSFDEDPMLCPAVVGGNVETSQRVVDTLLKTLGIQACSQGTMNNFLFGDGNFGYYETICGGAGAGPGYDGASALHTHMTNTAITDPEILEQRYPVRLHRFSLRPGSGGGGRWHGGNGIIREIEFLAPLEVSLLTQHRIVAPYGREGGSDGQCGRQTLNGKLLPGIAAFAANPGDRLVIETPGGGGWGTADAESK